MESKKRLRYTIDAQGEYYCQEIEKLKETIGELKSTINNIPMVEESLFFLKSRFYLWDDQYCATNTTEPKDPKPALQQRFINIKEIFDKQKKQISELLEHKKQSKMEIDDLKLRICMLEMKVNNKGDKK